MSTDVTQAPEVGDVAGFTDDLADGAPRDEQPQEHPGEAAQAVGLERVRRYYTEELMLARYRELYREGTESA